jgi:hypothetical protein
MEDVTDVRLRNHAHWLHLSDHMPLLVTIDDHETFSWWIDEPRLKGCGNPSDGDLAQLQPRVLRLQSRCWRGANNRPRYDRESARAAD